jgi:heme exporter protein A
VNIKVVNSEIIGVIGENGTGKTTLLKILSGILRPATGKVTMKIDGKEIQKEDIAQHIGFVSPYLILYEEFTPMEHLQLFAKLRYIEFNENYTMELLEEFNLKNRRNDMIKTFSSGMKQRVKYMISLQSKPEILFLDEPFTNLDTAGINSIKKIIELHVADGGGVIIASNDDREKKLCSRFTELKN